MEKNGTDGRNWWKLRRRKKCTEDMYETEKRSEMVWGEWEDESYPHLGGEQQPNRSCKVYLPLVWKQKLKKRRKLIITLQEYLYFYKENISIKHNKNTWLNFGNVFHSSLSLSGRKWHYTAVSDSLWSSRALLVWRSFSYPLFIRHLHRFAQSVSTWQRV